MTLQDIIAQLSGQAKPRPDLITPGATGSLENARPYTYAGRVQNANQPTTLKSIMEKMPIGEMEAGGQAMGAIPGATLAGIAFHGSPHKFSNFDMSKIGTGEGAAAFGHGLYFAEAKETAKQYQTQLKRFVLPGLSDAENEMLDPLLKRAISGNPQVTQKALGAFAQDEPRKAAAIQKYFQAGVPQGSERSFIYKADIPDEHIGKMLDWDKPLSEQSPEVKAIIPAVLAQAKKSFPESNFAKRDIMTDGTVMTGGELYRLYSQHRASPQAASKALAEMGIPGIKYLDQLSRGKGAGTSNFVVFDPKYIKSTERLSE
jgi:hypothetical protein